MFSKLFAAMTLVCASAVATPIVTLSYTPGSSNVAHATARNARAAFEANLISQGFDVTYEDFEDGPWTSGSKPFSPGGITKNPNPETRWYDSTITTDFGTWTANGIAGRGLSSRTNELVVLEADNNPFGGRFNTTPGGQFWLDTNDVTSVLFTPAQPIFALGFLLSDPTDEGSTFNVNFLGGDSAPFDLTKTILPKLGNKALTFFSIISDPDNPITSVQFFNTGFLIQADGVAMDDFVAASQQSNIRQPSPVPEPGTYALVGTALIALTWIRRRKANQR